MLTPRPAQLSLRLTIPASPEVPRCLATCDGLQCGDTEGHDLAGRLEHVAREEGRLRVWRDGGVAWVGGSP